MPGCLKIVLVVWRAVVIEIYLYGCLVKIDKGGVKIIADKFGDIAQYIVELGL